MKFVYFFALIVAVFYSCTEERLKETKKHSNIHVANIDRSGLPMQRKVYVPIYSDIYYRDAHHTFSLSATLSVRNVSFNDSIYIFAIDYYNSAGKKLRRYNEGTLLVSPMESIEFVVEDKDDSGGVGANFVIEWGAKAFSQPPYIQGVMIGTSGQQGISFVTEGIDIQ